jgi:hypothetical protein
MYMERSPTRKSNPKELEILRDGTQSEGYLQVDEAIESHSTT